MTRQSLLDSWCKLTLIEQLGNIGSEVGRARKLQGRDDDSFRGAVERAYELFDLTLRDKRWYGRPSLREIEVAKEVFADAVLGGREYKSSLVDLEKYFMQFAYLARNTK